LRIFKTIAEIHFIWFIAFFFILRNYSEHEQNCQAKIICLTLQYSLILTMRKPLLLLSLLAFGTAAMAQKLEPQSKTKNALSHEVAVRDHGYPVMKNTGNPDADYLAYKQAKLEWKAKNPALHSQMYPKTKSAKSSNRRNYKNSLQKSANNR
jgi:hypothetical protein